MKITIIAPYSFGYIDALVDKLTAKPHVEVEYIDLSTIRFEYSSFFHRVRNFFSKTFLKRNLKKEDRVRQIKEVLNKNFRQDVILFVRPDLVSRDLLVHAKSRTDKTISFYFDAINNIPEKYELLPYFDEVYSYEKDDVERYGLKFLTNFIPIDETNNPENSTGVFNISSYDSRSVCLENIAQQLEELNYPYRFMVKSDKHVQSDYLEVILNYLDIKDIKKYIETSDVLLDIQKENQKGLSFRVFEALGFEKKLITTNSDIRNYDFYNPANILIIDPKELKISKEFLETPYQKVPPHIYAQYTRDAWISKVFKI